MNGKNPIHEIINTHLCDIFVMGCKNLHSPVTRNYRNYQKHIDV